MDLPWVKLVIGAIFILVVLRLGFWMLRGFATPMGPEPELLDVDLRYRCSICGTELRITVATTEDPKAPRHCQEEMDLVAPIE